MNKLIFVLMLFASGSVRAEFFEQWQSVLYDSYLTRKVSMPSLEHEFRAVLHKKETRMLFESMTIEEVESKIFKYFKKNPPVLFCEVEKLSTDEDWARYQLDQMMGYTFLYVKGVNIKRLLKACELNENYLLDVVFYLFWEGESIPAAAKKEN